MLLPGFHQWTQAEYRARVTEANAFTASRVCRLARDPREPAIVESTDAMKIGSALHTAILEPADFVDRHPVAPECDRRTTIGKATWAEFQASCRHGAEPLTQAEAAQVMRGVDAVNAHREARALLSSHAMREGSALVKLNLADYDGGESCGIYAGARPDMITSAGQLVQLKTSWNGYDPKRFSYTMRDMRYAEGEAWCGMVAAMATTSFPADYRKITVGEYLKRAK
jgi:hypothetical protein